MGRLEQCGEPQRQHAYSGYPGSLSVVPEMVRLTYGMTIAQVQALPQFANKTVTDIQNMMYAFGVFNDLYGALFNVAALPQANREAYLVPFVS